jgi:hypothetical protein
LALPLAACGLPETLYAARRQLSDRERGMVQDLTHTTPDDAALLREYLATKADPKYADDVRAGKITKNMPAAELLRSWGEPDEARRGWFYDIETWTYFLNGDEEQPFAVSFFADEIKNFGSKFDQFAASDSGRVFISPNASPSAAR